VSKIIKPKRKTFLITFTNDSIREYSLPDTQKYYMHNMIDTINKEKFIALNNEIVACGFIRSIEDITEDME
jgi:hypothetical protein